MRFNLDRKLGKRLTGVLGVLAVVPLLIVTSGTVAKTSLDELYMVSQALNADAKASQTKIEAIADKTESLYATYRGVLKTIESLKIYNANLDRQVRDQEKTMATIRNSTQNVTKVQAELTPLMFRMVEVLDQFIANDKPFLLEERTNRVEKLRTLMDNSNVAESERFAQVIRAYQIESEYGRTMESYTSEIEVDGSTKIVDVLKVGRAALVYQTSDGSQSGWWNPSSKQWEVLPSKFSSSVRNGLKMAKKQLTAGLFAIPVISPEVN